MTLTQPLCPHSLGPPYEVVPTVWLKTTQVPEDKSPKWKVSLGPFTPKTCRRKPFLASSSFWWLASSP